MKTGNSPVCRVSSMQVSKYERVAANADGYRIASAYTCDDKFSCLTNEDHNIACGSGTYSPFFTVCLDYNAFKDGACDNANSLTGCWLVPPHPQNSCRICVRIFTNPPPIAKLPRSRHAVHIYGRAHPRAPCTGVSRRRLSSPC